MSTPPRRTVKRGGKLSDNGQVPPIDAEAVNHLVRSAREHLLPLALPANDIEEMIAKCAAFL